MFAIPRSNTAIRGSPAWKELIGRLMDAPMEFLPECYRMEDLESRLPADKRTTG